MLSTSVVKLSNFFEFNSCGLCLSFLVQLQDEAACALSCLDKCRDGGLEELFMTKVDFGAKFDSCLRYAELWCITLAPVVLWTFTGTII